MARTRHRRVTAVAVATLVALAAAWLALERDGGGQPLGWKDVTREITPLRHTHPTTRVFRTARELADYVGRSAPRRARGASPRLDFRRHRLVLVAVGARSSTGYAVEVVRLNEHRRRVVLTVREQAPTLASRTKARVTYPYRVLAVPVGRKPVEVRWLGRAERGIG